ncbi:MAG: hypothetical protein K2X86_11380 [Cytophagaceae bacterium]|nr:hypothetical protein [Cytophagaceae bacterium]
MYYIKFIRIQINADMKVLFLISLAAILNYQDMSFVAGPHQNAGKENSLT